MEKSKVNWSSAFNVPMIFPLVSRGPCPQYLEEDGMAAQRIQEAKLILIELEESVMSPQLTALAELIQEKLKDSPS